MGEARTPLSEGSGSWGARNADCSKDGDASSAGLASLFANFVCLRCGSSRLRYASTGGAADCPECAASYPVFDREARIPWLSANPESSLLEWKARYHRFLHSNSADLERLRTARAESEDRPLTRRRVSRILQAREQYRNQVIELLAPFDLESIDWPADTTAMLEHRLPGDRGLSRDVDRIFRDWAWSTDERDVLLDAVMRVADADPRSELGTLLVVGAGACRLSYDLHRRFTPRRTINIDLNPILLLVGARMSSGTSIELYEFPAAPLDAESSAVLQRCQAPAALEGDSFHTVAADLTDLPLADARVDTVLTPWLDDFVAQDLRAFLPRLNRCLAPGGIWINLGSLSLWDREESRGYTEDELFQLIEQSGFELLALDRRVASYLHSPHSARADTVNVLSFCARKVSAVDAVEPSHYLPKWLRDTTVPVPVSSAVEHRSSSHLLTAHILGAIDGKKTVAQIGRRVARQYGLGLTETVRAVRQVLLDVWEEGRQPRRERW